MVPLTDGTYVKSIVYNRSYTAENGEECCSATTEVTREVKYYSSISTTPIETAVAEVPEYQRATCILYHVPKGDGDRHFCDIYWLSGKVERVFDLCEIIFFPQTGEAK